MGPTGHVLATDLNTDALERLEGGHLEVRRHNIVHDLLPEAEFDLVNTRGSCSYTCRNARLCSSD